jgi:hypothetical protein
MCNGVELITTKSISEKFTINNFFIGTKAYHKGDTREPDPVGRAKIFCRVDGAPMTGPGLMRAARRLGEEPACSVMIVSLILM